MAKKINWPEAMQPLIDQYREKPHPLEYKNLYQLLVMVILSAQDSDKNINNVAPGLFKAYPNMKALAAADEASLFKLISKVRNFRNKTNWLLKMAQTIKTDKKIPLTMEELTALPGIGRKSANVIMRSAGVEAAGVIVDLHVVRVAPRIGIASGTDPKKIEQQIMAVMPKKEWGEIGMAISFLGRETCRPKHPEHHNCIVSQFCEYYHKNHKTAPKETGKKSAAKKPVKNTTVKSAAKKTKTVAKAGRR